ncbi:MAG: DNA gyrase subunit A [Desulfitobacteriaceae bacterium]
MSIFEENITQRPLEEVLPEAFMGYSKYVILHRAIPDVRDGLKPVHRRIIYSMNELGMYPDKQHSKSARLVGHCMGAYHPHGDSAIYEAAVRMAQKWASRYPSVDGHGNFGSVDGDPAAAMRYTEMRMTPLARWMCQDLEKDTVPFRPNYDNRLKEPVVLPSPFPNVLINGTGGIAVGVATNMPPHNLREVVAGIIKQIDNPQITVEDLLACVPGPDFPTGGFIIGREGIAEAYRTGRGKIVMRGKAALVPGKNGKSLIVITEIPYQVNKANLAAKIETFSEGKIDGISDVRDESDREGMRLVVECRKDADPQKILNQIYRYTQLQDSFGIINLVITANGTPKILNLPEINAAYIEHRREVVYNRTKHDLEKAKARAHILEGLVLAINHLDEVIALIRSSKTPALAKAALILRFEFSEVQAQAVLEMKLQHLTNLELDAITKEYEEILKLIASLKEILADKSKVYAIVKKELKEIADKYGDERCTMILNSEEDSPETVVQLETERSLEILLTKQEFIKALAQNRGGRGQNTVLAFKDGDHLTQRISCTDRDVLYFFSASGKVYSIAAKIIPEAAGKEKGKALSALLPLPDSEDIIAMLPVREEAEGAYFLFVTREGQVMRSPLTDFLNSRTPEAMSLRERDTLLKVFISVGEKDLLLVTGHGQMIRYPETEVNPMGRKSKGVRGINLDPSDLVVDALLLGNTEGDLLTITERGWVKRTALRDYKSQGRGGKGIAVAKIEPQKTGFIAGIVEITEDNPLTILQRSGMVTTIPPQSIKREARVKTGAIRVNVMLDDYVVRVFP